MSEYPEVAGILSTLSAPAAMRGSDCRRRALGALRSRVLTLQINLYFAEDGERLATVFADLMDLTATAHQILVRRGMGAGREAKVLCNSVMVLYDLAAAGFSWRIQFAAVLDYSSARALAYYPGTPPNELLIARNMLGQTS